MTRRKLLQRFLSLVAILGIGRHRRRRLPNNRAVEDLAYPGTLRQLKLKPGPGSWRG